MIKIELAEVGLEHMVALWNRKNTELCKYEIREFPVISWSVKCIYRLLPIIFLNPFQARVPFLHLLKTSEHFWFYDVFRGYINVILPWKGLNIWNSYVVRKKWPAMPQSAITCLKVTTETLEQGVKDIQSQQQRHHNDAWR